MKLKQSARKRIHQSSPAKKKLFVEGFALLRRLTQGPLSRDEAEKELHIPYREWYRWLRVFRECGIPLAIDYRYRRGKTREKTVRLWPQDWARLVDPGKRHPRAPNTEHGPTKREILKSVQDALNRVL